MASRRPDWSNASVITGYTTSRKRGRKAVYFELRFVAPDLTPVVVPPAPPTVTGIGQGGLGLELD